MKFRHGSLDNKKPDKNSNTQTQNQQNNIQCPNLLSDLQKHQKCINLMYQQLQIRHLIDKNNNIKELQNTSNQKQSLVQIKLNGSLKSPEKSEIEVLKPKSIQQQINEKEGNEKGTEIQFEDGQKIFKNFFHQQKNQIQTNQNKTQCCQLSQLEYVQKTHPQPQQNNMQQQNQQTNNQFEIKVNQNSLFEPTQNYTIFQNSRYDNIHFQKVADLLVKTFCNEQLTTIDLTQLQNYQLKVYLKILERRFKTQINSQQPIDHLKVYLNNKISAGSNTYLRSEEQYKFVLKKVIRIMKIEIKQELITQRKPNTNSFVNKQFLIKYFSVLAQQLKLSLDVFVPPTNINFKSTFKTVNKDYFCLIKKSELFVKDFMRIANQILIPFYVNEIREKFTYLTRQLDEQLQISDTNPFDEKVQQILHFLKNKKKLKLPWDVKTVEASISITISQFFSQFNFSLFQNQL